MAKTDDESVAQSGQVAAEPAVAPAPKAAPQPPKAAPVKVTVATAGRKKWLVTIAGVGVEMPNLQPVLDGLKAAGHQVDYARTSNEHGTIVVDALQPVVPVTSTK